MEKDYKKFATKIIKNLMKSYARLGYDYAEECTDYVDDNDNPIELSEEERNDIFWNNLIEMDLVPSEEEPDFKDIEKLFNYFPDIEWDEIDIAHALFHSTQSIGKSLNKELGEYFEPNQNVGIFFKDVDRFPMEHLKDPYETSKYNSAKERAEDNLQKTLRAQKFVEKVEQSGLNIYSPPLKTDD